MATDVSIFLLFIILYDFSLNPQTDWSIIQSLIKTNWRRNAAHKSFEWDEMSKLIGHWSGRPVETFGAALLDDWDICFVFQCSIAWKSEQSFCRVSLNIFIKCPVGRIQKSQQRYHKHILICCKSILMEIFFHTLIHFVLFSVFQPGQF